MNEISTPNKTVEEFHVGSRAVGKEERCFIIAEAGVSHFGNEEKAFQLIDMAVEARSDAVKFQIFDVNAMFSNELPDWKKRMGSRALPLQFFAELNKYAKDRGIIFLATAHDDQGLDILIDMDVDAYKIGSGELDNWPFISRIAQLNKPIFLSTGMYALRQVDETVDLICASGNRELGLLHCVTNYPAPHEEVNLRVIELYRERYGGVIGYSDHTQGFHVPLAAVALGAKVIEKHISMDFDVPDAQDWKVSCGPHNLSEFIQQVRDTEDALGVRSKIVSEAECSNKEWACKSIVLAIDKAKGQHISGNDVVFKRPGTGISPSHLCHVIGRKLKVSVKMDSVLRWECLE